MSTVTADKKDKVKYSVMQMHVVEKDIENVYRTYEALEIRCSESVHTIVTEPEFCKNGRVVWSIESTNSNVLSDVRGSQHYFEWENFFREFVCWCLANNQVVFSIYKGGPYKTFWKQIVKMSE